MKIALVSSSEVIKVWTTDQTELHIRYALPDGSQISPVVLGWANEKYAVVPVTEFVTPEGKRTIGSPSYTLGRGVVVETYSVEDIPLRRPMVRKSTVQGRLIEAGRMDDAYAMLTQHPVSFARWFAPDQPRIYCDDPDAMAFVAAMNLDPAIFLAPEGE
jgi:hypothetical protein